MRYEGADKNDAFSDNRIAFVAVIRRLCLVAAVSYYPLCLLYTDEDFPKGVRNLWENMAD